MENINKLIAQLIAICNYSKDIHYNSKGEAFYGKHLLADRVQENLSEYIDQIKEICLLGNDYKTLSSAEYLLKATSYIPTVEEEDKANFKNLENLLVVTLGTLEGLEGTKGEENLYGAIAQDLQNSLGLINRQIKD